MAGTEPVNAGDFARGNTDVILRVRGFDKDTGARSGGIKDPKPVTLTPGSVIMRLYQDPKYRHGEWLWTPYEMKQAIDYFAVDSPMFNSGRAAGKGLLQGLFAVRFEWGKNSPGHLGTLCVLEIRQPLMAYFGEGDSAPSADQRSNLKPIQITDAQGRNRGARQLFVPQLWNYASAFHELVADVPVDTGLIDTVRKYYSGPLAFET